ncbi:brachyurin-like [Cloeon dipterum]|uniref:brachyurin-like n=1 Tax=Cloeon dipterum TaxID=197152 RepID=UPI00321FCF65
MVRSYSAAPLSVFFLAFFALQASSLFIKTDRIIGGQTAAEGQFPYQAGIFIDVTRFCGGVLISPNYVLTAAHCIHNAESFEIHLGAEERNNLNEVGLVVDFTTDKIVHENFDLKGNKFDIALIKLTSTVNQPNIKPIELPSLSEANVTLSGLVGRLSGWGTYDDVVPIPSNYLKYVDVPIISNVECEDTYGADLITECSICAGTMFGTVGFCSGDTGGPMAIENDALEWKLIGIASLGYPLACENKAPQIYTRTACYLQWIADNSDVTLIP